MAVGYLTNGICYGSALDAIDAYYSNSYSVTIGGTYNNIYRPVKVGDVWYFEKFTAVDGIKTIMATPLSTNIYGACEYGSAAYDYTAAAGMWAFAFTWVIVFWYLTLNLGAIVNAVRKF